MNGLFCYDYDHLHVKAKKAWFCFDNKIVCLGAGITTDDENGAYTTINQCNMINKTAIVNGKEVNDGNYNLSEIDYVFSDDVGYVFLEKEKNVELITAVKKGRWSDVDTASGSNEEREKRMFLLGVYHGKKPVNVSYAYMLMPNASTDTLGTEVDHPSVEIVSNTPNCQAVWCEYLTEMQAVFYMPGYVKFKGITVEVDEACALMIKFNGEEYEIWVSNPDHEKLTVNVKVDNVTVTFNLEEGYMLNNLGRPLGYSSKDGFTKYTDSQLENLEGNIYIRYE